MSQLYFIYADIPHDTLQISLQYIIVYWYSSSFYINKTEAYKVT